MKRKIYSFFVTLMLLVSMGTTQNAYAESGWQQIYTGWIYIENGTIKTGWILTNGNWYYIDNSGTMQTGWIIDNGTWYYLSDNGALDDTKTTTIMPSELAIGYNRIKQYISENIKYSETLILNGESTYRFYGETLYSPNEYYYTPGIDRAFQLKQGVLTRLDNNEVVNTKYTYEQCKDIAEEYFNNSHVNGYKFTVNSDGKVNSEAEYYFTINSLASNEKLDSYYVSAMDGQVIR